MLLKNVMFSVRQCKGTWKHRRSQLQTKKNDSPGVDWLLKNNIMIWVLDDYRHNSESRYQMKVTAMTNLQVQGCTQKFPDRVDNKINKNKHSFRSNMKDYGGKIH
jgi:hypothetical protein